MYVIEHSLEVDASRVGRDKRIWVLMSPGERFDGHGGAMKLQPLVLEAIGDGLTTVRVRQLLAADPATTCYEIRVVTLQGVVELSGCVETSIEHSEALRLAGLIKGVLRVEDSLEIRTI